MKEILDAHVPPRGRLGAGHRGLFETITNSLHMQLGLDPQRRAKASAGFIQAAISRMKKSGALASTHLPPGCSQSWSSRKG
jgi:hypothetical protein